MQRFTLSLVISLLTLSGCGYSAHNAPEPPVPPAPADTGPAAPPDAGTPTPTPDRDAATVPNDSGAPDAGPQSPEEIFSTTCALCHGEDGSGYVADNAPALSNPDFLSVATDDFLREAITHGRPDTPMAAFGEEWGGPFNAAQIDELVGYIRSWESIPPLAVHDDMVEGTASNGRTVFAERCVECHGENGEGRLALSINNPRFLATVSDGYLRHTITYGRRYTMMPAWGSEISEAAIGDLVQLIRSWATPVTDPPPAVEPPSYDEIVINEMGDPPLFSPLREGRYVPAAEVNAALEAGARIVLLDARATSAYHAGHIPGAIAVPYYGTDEVVGFLPRDGTWIISYCACPHAASGRVMDALRAAGFPNTAVLDEGIVYWEEQGYPMETSMLMD